MEPTHLPEIKNTEDDTFRILARPNFNEIRHIIKENSNLVPYARIEFMKQYGWTWGEYIRECQRRNLSNSSI